MPDELIHCPACDHRLRVPPDLLGRMVECPQCRERFAAPVPVVSLASGVAAGSLPSDWIAARVRGPAICLLCACALGFAANLFGVMVGNAIPDNAAAFNDAMDREMDKNRDLTARQKADFKAAFTPEIVGGWMTVVCGSLLVGNAIAALGAFQMLRARTYWLAVLGAVLAMNPVNAPCCLIQVPFGLWSLIVLMNADVRRGFR